MPTAVAADGLLYAISDKGILTVLNTTNGEILSRARIGGKFAASPLLAGKALYLGSQEGLLTGIDRRTMKPLATNSMDGDLMASPAVRGSDLVMSHLFKTLSPAHVNLPCPSGLRPFPCV